MQKNLVLSAFSLLGHLCLLSLLNATFLYASALLPYYPRSGNSRFLLLPLSQHYHLKEMLLLSLLTTYLLSSNCFNSFQLLGLYILPQVSHTHNVKISGLAPQGKKGPTGHSTLKMLQKVILNITLCVFRVLHREKTQAGKKPQPGKETFTV